MSYSLLEIEGLVKRYKKVVAVNGISFSVGQGTCFGLLGPNGAGKTTALEVIEDIKAPTEGTVLYKGALRASSFREEIGIQSQHTALLEYLTVRETLATFQKLYRDPEDLDELIALCNLEDIFDHMNDKISGGQRQRLLLALALVNKPELLFLDEPSAGLDPQARRNLWDIVQSVKQRGKTIILTTHSMEEAEYLCDEIAIMDHGKIIASGKPQKLVKQYCNKSTIVLPKSHLSASFKTDQHDLPFSHRFVGDQVEIHTEDIHSTLKSLLEVKADLGEMVVRSPNLEDVFLNLTGRQLRD